MADNDNQKGDFEDECKIELYPMDQSKVNMSIMSYLAAEGFKQTAEKFQLEAGLDPMDKNYIERCMIMREAIQNGMIQRAVHFAHQLQPEVLQRDRQLVFQLQNQQLIEMIRSGKIESALVFAQTTLRETVSGIPGGAEELGRTLSLLVFENPEQSPFAHLLSMSHKNRVANDLIMALITFRNIN